MTGWRRTAGTAWTWRGAIGRTWSLWTMRMPEIDGWETAPVLKSAAGTGGIPAVAWTAHAMAGGRKKARKAGVRGLSAKPVHLELPREIVGRLAGK